MHTHAVRRLASYYGKRLRQSDLGRCQAPSSHRCCCSPKSHAEGVEAKHMVRAPARRSMLYGKQHPNTHTLTRADKSSTYLCACLAVITTAMCVPKLINATIAQSTYHASSSHVFASANPWSNRIPLRRR